MSKQSASSLRDNFKQQKNSDTDHASNDTLKSGETFTHTNDSISNNARLRKDDTLSSTMMKFPPNSSTPMKPSRMLLKTSAPIGILLHSRITTTTNRSKNEITKLTTQKPKYLPTIRAGFLLSTPKQAYTIEKLVKPSLHQKPSMDIENSSTGANGKNHLFCKAQ